jgi:hypothetical protein
MSNTPTTEEREMSAKRYPLTKRQARWVDHWKTLDATPGQPEPAQLIHDLVERAYRQREAKANFTMVATLGLSVWVSNQRKAQR